MQTPGLVQVRSEQGVGEAARDAKADRRPGRDPPRSTGRAAGAGGRTKSIGSSSSARACPDRREGHPFANDRMWESLGPDAVDRPAAYQ